MKIRAIFFSFVFAWSMDPTMAQSVRSKASSPRVGASKIKGKSTRISGRSTHKAPSRAGDPVDPYSLPVGTPNPSLMPANTPSGLPAAGRVVGEPHAGYACVPGTPGCKPVDPYANWPQPAPPSSSSMNTLATLLPLFASALSSLAGGNQMRNGQGGGNAGGGGAAGGGAGPAGGGFGGGSPFAGGADSSSSDSADNGYYAPSIESGVSTPPKLPSVEEMTSPPRHAEKQDDAKDEGQKAEGAPECENLDAKGRTAAAWQAPAAADLLRKTKLMSVNPDNWGSNVGNTLIVRRITNDNQDKEALIFAPTQGKIAKVHEIEGENTRSLDGNRPKYCHITIEHDNCPAGKGDKCKSVLIHRVSPKAQSCDTKLEGQKVDGCKVIARIAAGRDAYFRVESVESKKDLTREALKAEAKVKKVAGTKPAPSPSKKSGPCQKRSVFGWCLSEIGQK